MPDIQFVLYMDSHMFCVTNYICECVFVCAFRPLFEGLNLTFSLELRL